MFTQLALNKMFFMVELLIAEYICFSGRKRKRGFPARLAASCAACLVLAFFFPILVYNAIYASVMFFFLLAITLPFMKFCYDESWISVLFCCFAAFTVEEIAYAVSQLVMAGSSFFIGGGDYTASVADMILGSYGNGSVQITTMFYLLSNLTFYSVTYLLCWLIFIDKLKKNDPEKLRRPSYFLYAFLIVVTVIILNTLVVYHSQTGFDQIYFVVFMIFMAFGCVTALTLQFSILDNGQLQDELSFFSYLLKEKEKQRVMSMESVDIINQKCHDLKHMIKSWRNQRGIRDEELMEIEQAISIYGSEANTGNETLDVVLTEKSLSCLKYGITLSSFIDAERLNFMQDTDLYVLFGNILDNAIEAVKQIGEPEKRIISLNISRANEMLSIGTKNYFAGTIVMENGLPRTSKGDRNYHGFGLKSIRRIVEKYGGSMTLNVEDDVFCLSIIFPSAGI